jgi:hypothetical protein
MKDGLIVQTITKNISNGLANNEIDILGAGGYLFIQECPISANAKIRFNSNYSSPIAIEKNVTVKADGINKVFLTCDAVENEKIVILQSKNDKRFEYIPALKLNNKIDVGTVDKIMSFDENAELNVKVKNDIKINEINKVNEVTNFSDELFHNLCRIINPYEFEGIDFYAFNSPETTCNTLTKVIEYNNCPYDKLKLDVILYPSFKTDDGNEIVTASEFEYPYVEILLDDSVVYVCRPNMYEYSTNNNSEMFVLENIYHKNIKVKIINGYISPSYYSYPSTQYLQDIRINVYKYTYKTPCINDYTDDTYNIALDGQGSTHTGSKHYISPGVWTRIDNDELRKGITIYYPDDMGGNAYDVEDEDFDILYYIGPDKYIWVNYENKT